MDVVAKARKRNPFKVVQMRSSDFIDLTAMSNQLCNRKKDTDGNKVSWLNIQTIRFTHDTPGIMKIQYVCGPDGPWFYADLRKTCHSTVAMKLIKASSEPRKLNLKKIKDLRSLMPFIPPVYHAFYAALQADESDVNGVLPFENDILDSSEYESTSDPHDDNDVRIYAAKKKTKQAKNNGSKRRPKSNHV
jgi:hypothetical protein